MDNAVILNNGDVEKFENKARVALVLAILSAALSVFTMGTVSFVLSIISLCMASRIRKKGKNTPAAKKAGTVTVIGLVGLCMSIVMLLALIVIVIFLIIFGAVAVVNAIVGAITAAIAGIVALISPIISFLFTTIVTAVVGAIATAIADALGNAVQSFFESLISGAAFLGLLF